MLNQMNHYAIDCLFIQRPKPFRIDVLLCANQDIPLWGHMDNEKAVNKDNFLQLVMFKSKNDQKI